MERFRIKLRFDPRHFQQRLDLRSKGQMISQVKIVERLHSKVVSRQKQSRCGGTQVTDGKSKHSVQALYTVHSFFFVQMNHHFGIRVGSKTMALSDKIVYELDDIDRKTTIFVEGEIDKLSCAVAGFTSCVSVPDGAPPEGSKS